MRPGFDPWVRKSLWRREWLPTLVLFPGEFHGQRSPASYNTVHGVLKSLTQLKNFHFFQRRKRGKIYSIDPMWTNDMHKKRKNERKQKGKQNKAHNNMVGTNPNRLVCKTNISSCLHQLKATVPQIRLKWKCRYSFTRAILKLQLHRMIKSNQLENRILGKHKTKDSFYGNINII